MNNLLEQQIETLTSRIPFKKLEQASTELSLSYRAQTDGIKSAKPFMFTENHKLAYLALRMPATYAAIADVLKKIPIQVKSLLDIGSGPGTAFWAAMSQFPKLNEALLIERDKQMIGHGKELLSALKNIQVEYLASDITSYSPAKSYDLITAAYSLSELSENALESVVTKLWSAANPILCLIEPGTPYGFNAILRAREILLKQNAFIVAPCTHSNPCPWQSGNPWCHFSTRFERTRLQKRVKGAELGYEDEKYSYLIVSKTPLPRPESRIVKSPIKRSGFLSLTLCDASGIHDQTFSKKQKQVYLDAKKLDWGDGYTPLPQEEN